ncbi:MAG: LysR family transcriptional regulator [Myxococcaceae bacterium]|nr:LysR family transcriptional regulator [Myxococcaceae bacterium]
MLPPRELPAIATFAMIARHRSFTVAARELGLTKSVVSAQLRALEQKCGVRLLERTTRHVRLTSAGSAAYAAAEQMLHASRVFERAVSSQRSEPTGRLRIGVPHGLAATVIAPLVAELVLRHRGLQVEMVVNDALQDLLRDGLDVAVRIGTPRDSAYVLKRLGASSVIAVGSPRLELRAARRPSELAGAPWVRHLLVDRSPQWTFSGPGQQKERIRPSIGAAVNTMDAFRALLVSGAGVGAIPELHVKDDLARGALIPLCPGWVKRQVAVYALVPSRAVPAHAAFFLDALSGVLRSV